MAVGGTLCHPNSPSKRAVAYGPAPIVTLLLESGRIRPHATRWYPELHTTRHAALIPPAYPHIHTHMADMYAHIHADANVQTIHVCSRADMGSGDPTGRHVCILADRRAVMQTELCTGGRIPAFGYIYICILPLSFRWGACHYRKARARHKLFGLSPRVVHHVVRFKQQWTWCGGYRLSNRLLSFNRCRAARYLNSDGRQPGIGSNNYIVGANHLISASKTRFVHQYATAGPNICFGHYYQPYIKQL